jgi:hypothetical protein
MTGAWAGTLVHSGEQVPQRRRTHLLLERLRQGLHFARAMNKNKIEFHIRILDLGFARVGRVRFGGSVDGKRAQPADAVAFVGCGVGVKIAIGEVGKDHCHGNRFVGTKALRRDAIVNHAGGGGGIQVAIDHLPPVNEQSNAADGILHFIAH